MPRTTMIHFHRLKKGLDLPITGEPVQRIEQGRPVTSVALMAADYVGMRPTMRVAVGDAVRRGQVLFEDKKTPGVLYTAPGAGTVVAINRGERRALQSVVIRLNENEQAGTPADEDLVAFGSLQGISPRDMRREQVRALLVESGLWTTLRTRPFSKVPSPDSTPAALFITAMDTNPLAPSVEEVLRGKEEDFLSGMACLTTLCDGPVYLCIAPESKMHLDPDLEVEVAEFSGPHPAGTVGVHIHFLNPVHRDKVVWHINYQDVIAVGRLASSGKLDVERTVSLAGPGVAHPRLLTTRIGACVDELVAGELTGDDTRVISGSVLSGRKAVGEIHGYLGRFHHQISVVPEARGREFLGWMMPGLNTFSVTNLFASRLLGKKRFPFTTTANGGKRAMVPIGVYERVMPMDIMPTFLLRALLAGDIEQAEKLGCLELDEEDLALCSFVCPVKIDYGPVLRGLLEQIEKEG